MFHVMSDSRPKSEKRSTQTEVASMPVAVAIDPRGLIEHARVLARHQSGAGRPRAIWIRRGASAAYYAVFHDFALRVGAQAMPQAPLVDRHRLTRSVGHVALREVCRWVSGNPGAGKQHVQSIVAALQADADISQLGDITFRLQETRHLADYDHGAAFGKASVLSSIDQAERALNTLDAKTGSPELEGLLALIALHSKLR